MKRTPVREHTCKTETENIKEVNSLLYNPVSMQVWVTQVPPVFKYRKGSNMPTLSISTVMCLLQLKLWLPVRQLLGN